MLEQSFAFLAQGRLPFWMFGKKPEHHAVSPNGDLAAKKAEMISVVQLLTETVNPGEQATIFDGLTTRTLCTFAVPNKRSYASAKAKLNINRACVGELIGFAGNANVDGPAGQLDLPGTMRAVVQSVDMDTVDAVVILGSPIFANPQEPSTTMEFGHVPSDGHISVSRTASPHSMAGLTGALEGTPVHLSSDGYDWSRNTRHEEMVHRFTWLTMATLGGPLVTFNADRDQLLERVKRGVDTSPINFERAASDKLEMIHVGLDRAPGLPIHEREITTEPLTAAQMRRVEDVEVGITWDCACDMDIYVRPHTDSAIIFFANPRTNEGRFYRDYRNGRDLLNGLESISFDAPINLTDMVIGVNFYSGSAPNGVTGEIRIAVGDKTYAKPFNITATTGNRAKGASEAFNTLEAPNERWVLANGREVVSTR